MSVSISRHYKCVCFYSDLNNSTFFSHHVTPLPHRSLSTLGFCLEHRPSTRILTTSPVKRLKGTASTWVSSTPLTRAKTVPTLNRYLLSYQKKNLSSKYYTPLNILRWILWSVGMIMWPYSYQVTVNFRSAILVSFFNFHRQICFKTTVK